MSPNKQRINMMIDEDLLKRLDELSDSIGKSRSAVMCDLLDRGLQQAYTATRFAGNRHLLRVINWLFGFSGVDTDNSEADFDEEDKRVNVARELILKEMKKLSVISAEKEFEDQIRSTNKDK